MIPSVLLRFREHRIGVVSDIRKAFLMIDINEEDRDCLRFLWLDNLAEKKIKIYRHRRVLFGLNCSPFQLAAVIQHHLSLVPEEKTDITKKLLEWILSFAQKIFDPVDFLSPVLLVPKLLLQESWLRKLSWDDEVPVQTTLKYQDIPTIYWSDSTTAIGWIRRTDGEHSLETRDSIQD